MNFADISGSYGKWESSSLHVLGDVLLGLGLTMIPCMLFSLWNGENYEAFLIPIVICLFFALLLIPLFKLPKIIKPVDGLFMVGMVWVIAILVSAVPFILSGMDFVDSIFESTSGLTTTGATIMTDIESWSSGILLWRSMMQWVGGIAIIMLFLLILPMIGFGGRLLFGNEISGSGSNNFTIRLYDAAKQFIYIYALLTFALIVILALFGTNFYESLCISLSTISTGGFMCKNDSLIGYNNFVTAAVTVFMFLGATNFYLHFKAITKKDPKIYVKNEEFTLMVLWYIVAIIIVFGVLYGESLVMNSELVDNFVDVSFNVISAATTTGFVADDYEQWFPAATAVMLLTAVIGGASGSTSGGMKIGRLIIIVRHAKNVLNQMLHPRAVYDVKLNGASVNEDTISSAVVIVVVFFATIVIGAMFIMLCGTEFTDAIAMSIASITSFGPATEMAGPLGSFYYESWYTKLFLAFLMWLGRLEVLTGLILLTPGFWKEFIISKKSIRKNAERFRSAIKR